MRKILGTICAVVYRARTRGRVLGTRYILRAPSRLRVSRGNTVTIGRDVMIDKGARIVALGGNITIGDNTFIGKNSTLIAFADLDIGTRVLIGQNCSIHTEDHGGPGARDDFTSHPIRIGDDVWLAAGVVVTSGSSVAPCSTVGANGVVTRELTVPGVYGGVPVKLIRGLD